MSATLKFAVLQMCSTNDVEENLSTVETAMQQAQSEGVDVMLLPENFAQMPLSGKQLHIETAGTGLVQDFLSEKSRQYSLTTIAGSLAVRDSNLVSTNNKKPFARSLVYDVNGDCILHYDKIHLYDVDTPSGENYHESNTYNHGKLLEPDQHPVFKLNEVTIGLSVCYDLRFPELYRQLTEVGAHLITVPAAFTYETGRAHWQTLLTARAIENQVFIAAAGQTGVHANGRRTWGHSMVINPWGKKLNQKKTSTGLLVENIDLSELQSLRSNFPVLKHKRIY